jgi:hypothetical protein
VRITWNTQIHCVGIVWDLCYDRRSVGQSVLKYSMHMGLTTTYFLVFDKYGPVFVGRPLWRDDGSVFYICCWPLPAQSLSVPSPNYCLRFETSLSSPPATRRVTVEILDPTSTRVVCGQNSEFCNIYKFSPYLTGNTLRLRHKCQPVNSVQGNTRCMLWEPYKTQKHIVLAGCGVLKYEMRWCMFIKV